jgi:hypothetical protein
MLNKKVELLVANGKSQRVFASWARLLEKSNGSHQTTLLGSMVMMILKASSLKAQKEMIARSGQLTLARSHSTTSSSLVVTS